MAERVLCVTLSMLILKYKFYPESGINDINGPNNEASFEIKQKIGITAPVISPTKLLVVNR